MLTRRQSTADRWTSPNAVIRSFQVTRTGLRDVRERAVDAGAAGSAAASSSPPPSPQPSSSPSGAEDREQKRGAPVLPEHSVHRKRRGTGRADAEQRAEQRVLQRPQLEFGEPADAGRGVHQQQHEPPREPAGPRGAAVSAGRDKREFGAVGLHLKQLCTPGASLRLLWSRRGPGLEDQTADSFGTTSSSAASMRFCTSSRDRDESIQWRNAAPRRATEKQAKTEAARLRNDPRSATSSYFPSEIQWTVD